MARYYITIYYDPLYIISDIADKVETAINNYHDNLIDFGGGVDLRKLEDEIQKVKGVVNFVTTSAQAQPEGGDWITFNRRYDTLSGYIQDSEDYPAKRTTEGGTIEYVANINA